MIRFLALLASLFLATIGEAKTLYVDAATGSDTLNSYATNDASHKWATIGRAAWGNTNPAATNSGEAAQAGDTVLVTAGTYTTTSATTTCTGQAHRTVALNPVNSGSSGNIITFRAVGTVTVLLGSGYAGPTLGSYQKDYIVWDGFTIRDDLALGTPCSDTGPVVLFQSTGSQFINGFVTGTYTDWISRIGASEASNYNGIRTEKCISCIVKNNTITAITGSYGTNNAGIMMYDTDGGIFEHNDISSSNTGIYVKGDTADAYTQQNNILRFNRIYNTINSTIELGAAKGTQVYQNLLKGTGYSGVLIEGFGPPQSTDITIQNNTIVSTNQVGDNGIGYGPLGAVDIVNLRFYNNIVYGSFSEAVKLDASAIGDQHFEHNIYNGYDSFGSWSNVSGRTFATWQGTGQDSAAIASVTTAPSFVNTTDYKLNGVQTASTLGVDILNLSGGGTSAVVPAGAYITGSETIGVQAAASSTYSTSISGPMSMSGGVTIR